MPVNYQNSDIIPVWQPQGYSTYQITKDIAVKTGKKTTHTGVLDPMAEGVIIVLAGDKRFEKSSFSDGKKIYNFDITFGLSTDSYDGMGIVTQIDICNQPKKGDIVSLLGDFSGDYTQTVPLYSARKVDGKKLFMYPRLGLPTPPLPEKKGTIYNLLIQDFRKVSLEAVIAEILEKISNIRIGEFRQAEIISCWKSLLSETESTCQVYQASFSVEMSRGLYVRSLSQDICYKLGVPGFVSNLIRIQNGSYTKNECCTVDQVC